MHTCMSLAAALIASLALLCCPTPAPAAAEDHPPAAPFGSGVLNGNQVTMPISVSGNALGRLGLGVGR